MNMIAVSLVAVYIYIYIESSLENKASIFPYALLKFHARDG